MIIHNQYLKKNVVKLVTLHVDVFRIINEHVIKQFLYIMFPKQHLDLEGPDSFKKKI